MMKIPRQEQTTVKTPSKRRKEETFTIGYRIDMSRVAQLQKEAAPYGLSVHEYARLKLLETLDRNNENRILEETTTIARGIEELRQDVAATLEVVLINTTKASTSEEQGRIRQWIRQYLRRGE